MTYLLGIDQGTTGTLALVVDERLRGVASAYRRVAVSHPNPGWVEQEPEDLLQSIVETVADVLEQVGGPGRVSAAGLANQGETVIAFDGETGRVLAPSIVWQCRRSQGIVDRLAAAGLADRVQELSGLPLDPYFSSSKLSWLLEEVEAVREATALRFGTSDAWLRFRLGAGYTTDPATASRTQLLELDRLTWSDRLLEIFGLPAGALPELIPTTGELGRIGHERWGGSMPLCAASVDQQAALAGHACFEPGRVKATYGTGCFVLAYAGTAVPRRAGLIPTVAWSIGGRTDYALDGGVLSAGTVLDWLAGLGLGAAGRRTSGSVRLLPALTGLGAPWWRPHARGVIAGLTPDTTGADLLAAALDGIAFRVRDIVEAIGEVDHLSVDGGLTRNDALLQRQADILGQPLFLAASDEATATGIAALAGLGAGVFSSLAELADLLPARGTVEPRQPVSDAEYARWRAFAESASLLQ